MATTKKIRKDRQAIIEKYSDDILNKVLKVEQDMFRAVEREFIARLQVGINGRILNNRANKELLTQIDKVFNTVVRSGNLGITSDIIGSLDKLLDLNKEGFTGFGSAKEIDRIDKLARRTMYDLLGLTPAGRLRPDGYLNAMLNDSTALARIKNEAMKAIISQQQASTFTQGMDVLITGGNVTKTGVMREFYQKTALDITADTDRIIGQQYASELKLQFAIYAGTIIKTTRDFCRERVGKVFHISEIMKFDPKTAKQPAYNPLQDCGGYGCRHSYNWISDALAVRMRPEAKKFITTAEE